MARRNRFAQTVKGRICGIIAILGIVMISAPTLAFAFVESSEVEKSTVPTLSKEVSLDGNSWGDRVDAPAGAELFYQVTATLPGYTEPYDKYPYAFVDTHEASIGIDTNSIKVYLISGGKSVDVTPSFDITNQGDTTRVSVDNLKETFPDLSSNDKFLMSYKARLSASPDLGLGNPNENACHLEYMTDVLMEKDPGTYGTGKMDRTPDEMTFVYSYGIEIVKVSAKDAHPLAGARFSMTDKDGRPFVEGGWGQLGSSAKEFVTADDGKTQILGIGASNVILTETEAPDGYRLANPVQVSLSRQSEASGKPELHALVDGALKNELDSSSGILRITIEDSLSDNGVEVLSSLTQMGAGLPVIALATGGTGLIAFIIISKRRQKLEN